MRERQRLLPILACTLLLTACGNDLRWTEDVRLPDGRVVTLKRWVEFKGPHTLGDTPTESRQRFEFKHPETGQDIKWENTKTEGIIETVALWLDKGQPMMLVKPAYGDDSHKYKCPNPPYLMLEYVTDHWQRKPLVEVPLKIIRANLTTHPKQARQDIETSQHHLIAAKTSDSYTYVQGVHQRPYIIKFEGMPVQTFEDQNCSLGPSLNTLIYREGVK